MTKSPKLYMADTGLLLYLLSIRTQEDLFQSPLLGSIWETFVFNELRKKQIRESGHWSLFFWRDRSKEIDFLIHRGGRFDLIEVKWSERPTTGDTIAFQEVASLVGKESIASKTIVCRALNPFPLRDGVHATPLREHVTSMDRGTK